MATRKDLLKAQAFTSRRMIAAFVDRDPDDPTPPLRRVGTATFVSVLLGVVLLAGTALIGMLRGGAPAQSWQGEAGVIVSDTQAGVLFVWDGEQLIPMSDVASARLQAGGKEAGGEPRVIEVKTDSLRGVKQGTERGIPGAPRQLPAAKDLESYPVRLCSAAPMSGNRRYLTLEFGKQDQHNRDMSFVALADNGTEYLVSGGKTHELYRPRGGASGLAENLPRVKPGDSWIRALPNGLPINPKDVPGAYGTDAANSPRSLTIGQMAKVEGTETSPTRYYIQLDQGLASISYMEMKLIQQVKDDPRDAVVLKDSEVASHRNPNMESFTQAGIPMYEMTGPAGYNSLSEASVCATFTEDNPNQVALSVGQPTPQIPQNSSPPRGNYIDLVTSPALSGALLRNADALSDDVATTLLLNGKGYQIPSMVARKALGYGDVTPLPVPGGLIDLLPPGLTTPGLALSLEYVVDVE